MSWNVIRTDRNEVIKRECLFYDINERIGKLYQIADFVENYDIKNELIDNINLLNSALFDKDYYDENIGHFQREYKQRIEEIDRALL